MWPNNALTDRLGIELPIIQAPMAGAATPALAAAVSNAGALGSLGFATSSIAAIGEQIERVRHRSNRALNWNFFCHPEPTEIEATVGGDEEAPGADLRRARAASARGSFGAVRKLRERSSGADRSPSPADRELSLRTSRIGPVGGGQGDGCGGDVLRNVGRRGRLLAERGADVIIAQGAEAGGHRGTFTGLAVTQQAGTMALVPQIVDAVDRPVVAAGGITDGRGIAAALMLGASAVQMGTAFLFCPESQVSAAHRKALRASTRRCHEIDPAAQRQAGTFARSMS